jgi:hypothetical protein
MSGSVTVASAMYGPASLTDNDCSERIDNDHRNLAHVRGVKRLSFSDNFLALFSKLYKRDRLYSLEDSEISSRRLCYCYPLIGLAEKSGRIFSRYFIKAMVFSFLHATMLRYDGD